MKMKVNIYNKYHLSCYIKNNIVNISYNDTYILNKIFYVIIRYICNTNHTCKNVDCWYNTNHKSKYGTENQVNEKEFIFINIKTNETMLITDLQFHEICCHENISNYEERDYNISRNNIHIIGIIWGL